MIAPAAPSLERVAAIRHPASFRLQEHELRAALDVSNAILTGLELDAVLQLAAVHARTLVRADGVAVRMAGADDQTLVLRAVSELPGRRGLPVLPRELPVRGSICGAVFETGRAQLLPDVGGPSILVPLRAQGRALGVLIAAKAGGRPRFRRRHLGTLRRFANQVAQALLQAQLAPERDGPALVEERKRLGRDLHDGAMQSLYSVTLRLSAAIERAEDRHLQDQLTRLTMHLDTIIADLRGHVRALRSGAGTGD